MRSSQQEKQRVLVASIDFDGCMGHEVFTSNFKQYIVEPRLKTDTPEYVAAYKHVIRESNRELLADLVKKSRYFDRVVVMVGSNRQSADKDRYDGAQKKNGNGSCFAAIKMLTEILQEEGAAKDVNLDKYLVYDSIMGVAAGSNFNLDDDLHMSPEADAQYRMSLDKKYRLAYFQIQRACASFPAADVSYVHYDDRDDIVLDTVKALHSEGAGAALPPNLVHASACHYELYNPIAAVSRIFSEAKKSKEEEPNTLVPEHIIKKLLDAVAEVSLQAISLLKLTAKYAAEIAVMQNKLREFSAQLAEGNTDKRAPEFKQMQRDKLGLENFTQQFENAESLVSEMSEIAKQVSARKEPICWAEFYNITAQLNKYLNKSIRENNLALMPDLSREFASMRMAGAQEHITEAGEYHRGGMRSTGYQVPANQLDELVRVCMQDEFIQTGTKDPFGQFVDKSKEMSARQEVLLDRATRCIRDIAKDLPQYLTEKETIQNLLKQVDEKELTKEEFMILMKSLATVAVRDIKPVSRKKTRSGLNIFSKSKKTMPDLDPLLRPLFKALSETDDPTMPDPQKFQEAYITMAEIKRGNQDDHQSKRNSGKK